VQALTEVRKLLAEARDWLQRREGELSELQAALQEAVSSLWSFSAIVFGHSRVCNCPLTVHLHVLLTGRVCAIVPSRLYIRR
jgi:hypothetical protein